MSDKKIKFDGMPYIPESANTLFKVKNGTSKPIMIKAGKNGQIDIDDLTLKTSFPDGREYEMECDFDYTKGATSIYYTYSEDGKTFQRRQTTYEDGRTETEIIDITNWQI